MQPIPHLPADEIRRRFVAFFAARGHEVVPSAGLVPAGDPTLLFTNSGMVQFKDVLTGRETRSYSRAVDYQRCLRVAGKHNDFEEVGRTPRHHTLFEMLGNWSFGDYFKREAIAWAWELLTDGYGIPGDRLAATVYGDDEEAYAAWHEMIGLPPERIARWGDIASGDEKNFWRMADTGPAGRCSEVHFDRGAEFSEGDFCIPDHSEVCPRWLEVWNLVFMEFERFADGTLEELPFKSVDTGMGLERLASVVQGAGSNYDTDLFLPLHDRMRDLLGHEPAEFESQRFSYQVIADHARAVTFLVADGVTPSNEDRGYVLRRILRRAARHGRLLGYAKPFLAEIADVVVDVMAPAYPYLADERPRIIDVIRRDEALFARTLDAGVKHLESAILKAYALRPHRIGASHIPEAMVGRRAEELPASAPVMDGADAFRLHDTYGFPVDLTVELAAERGVRVDRPGFEEALAEQRARSRAGTKGELARLAQMTQLYEQLARRAGETRFVGYETTAHAGRVLAILRDGIEYEELAGEGAAEVILDVTPFYGEGGGQIGDRGALRGGGPEAAAVFEVEDTQRPVVGLIVHRGRLAGSLRVGQTVHAEVDAGRRARTMRNHTGTHLLHRALRNVVGPAARQAGSLVTPQYLRFDYPLDRPLAGEERLAIEDEVRRIIREDRPVTPRQVTMGEAVELGADAFFDEKYGETVRIVEVAGYSRELCGGTHCAATGQVGGFVIVGDRPIGSGMRRVEALTGDGADALARGRLAALDRVAELVGAPDPSAAAERVAMLQGRLRELERRLRAGGGGLPKPAELARRADELAPDVRWVSAEVDLGSVEELKAYARDVRGALPSGVIALVLAGDEPQLFVTVSEDLVARGLSAAELVRVGAAAIGGRGGGRPEMAQGKGRGRQRAGEALAAMRDTATAGLAGASGA
ncbi:MAG: alanine--tRNA ligase [Chloroflexi bacterium GWC2_73_18]|nr:MAG: alanine--tRNA ligase [Chloroflexi bacterium GWC2_73_18]